MSVPVNYTNSDVFEMWERIGTIDVVLCCIPVVSTVTNIVVLLAQGIMKAIEKCFGESRGKTAFAAAFKNYLRERPSVGYIALIPVIGNGVLGAMIVYHNVLRARK